MATAARRPWRVRSGLLGVRAYLRPRAQAPTFPSPCSASRPSPAWHHLRPLPSRPPWPPPPVSLPSSSSQARANRPRQELRRAKPHLLSFFPRPGKHRSVVPTWRPSHRSAKLRPPVSTPSRPPPSPLHPAPSTRAPRSSNRRRRQRPVASLSAGLRKKETSVFLLLAPEKPYNRVPFFCVL
jgi:hypothetical protein